MWPALTLMPLLTACPPPTSPPPASTGVVTGTPTTVPWDTGPFDLDADGWFAGDDCDDTASGVHPDATEVWNGVDDDCDGRVDGDGTYAGTASLSTSVIYDGTSYRWPVEGCAVTLQRLVGSLTWRLTCQPVPADPADQAIMDLALGKLLEAHPLTDPTTASGERWEGSIEWVSDGGWTARGEGSATWEGFDRLTLSLGLDAVFLDISGGGEASLQ